jgi:hypothetical protein
MGRNSKRVRRRRERWRVIDDGKAMEATVTWMTRTRIASHGRRRDVIGEQIGSLRGYLG